MGNDCMGAQSYHCSRCRQAINYEGLCSRCKQINQGYNSAPVMNNVPLMYSSNPFPSPTSDPILSIPRQFTAHPQGDGLYKIHELFQKKDQFINEKIPLNKDMTHFKYEKRTAWFYPKQIRDMRLDIMRTRTFQEKLLWFRLNVQRIRVPWHQGGNQLRIDRVNLIRSSIGSLNKKTINFHMEMKIVFEGEEVLDAGGVQREWMHLVLKQLFSEESNVFALCDTQETAYKFKNDKANNKHKIKEFAWLLGVVLGKAIFDRISINCYLNRCILRQLCNQPVYFNDFFNYDQKLYQSFNSILKSPKAEDLGLDFCIYRTNEDGTLDAIDLCPNGANTMVTDANKQKYIKDSIAYYTTNSAKEYIQQIKAGLYKVVPQEMLMVFEPHQLQSIINGPPTIDTHDWQAHTVYKGYTADSQQVRWFWEAVHGFDQQQLQNLLHYCTGTTRVPVLGFKYLESNRNQIAKFSIHKCEYNRINPFPKSHTCFNRIQLPVYSSRQQLLENLLVVVNQEHNFFGME